MFIKKEKVNGLEKQIDNLNKILSDMNIRDFAEIVGSRKQIFTRNLIAGVTKGIGMGIGITLMTALIIFLLQKAVTLNLPIIGDFIADIVKIVETKV